MGCKGCTVCTTSSKDGKPSGCGSNGNCSTGGCNRLNTFDWLSNLDIVDAVPLGIVEVSFKNGARKSFFKTPDHIRTITGDWVVVETGNGYDIGTITLSGDLVRLQMKKKRAKEDDVMHAIIRRANDRDLERLQEARSLENPTLVRSRAIARTLGLEMKIGDIEYQGDKRKATFFYTADGRVDFRELIRHFAKEFKVKIEMRQIGARQESARIGGVGSCGRELCCSTWLSDFKSVSTSAARYQNLAINQAKLSGQCGRLKCCLNYELDTYLEALEDFPEGGERLKTSKGNAILIKTDIFKKIMFYVIEGERGKIYPLPVDKVAEIIRENKAGVHNFDLSLLRTELVFPDAEEEIDFADVTGEIELPEERRRKKKKRGNRNNRRSGQNRGSRNQNQNREKKDQKGQPNQNKKRPNKSNNTQNKGKSNSGGQNTQGDQKSENSNQSSKSRNKNRKNRNWRNKKRNNTNKNDNTKKD
ncbi:MAG: regulatory iron-sulfur-containing complex subunit RicT [Bacteroidota bacterium]